MPSARAFASTGRVTTPARFPSAATGTPSSKRRPATSGAQRVGVVRGAGERVERVAEAGEPDDVQRRGGVARDGVEL
jgi:hypothetical protein